MLEIDLSMVGFDVPFHLASLYGGASDLDPVLNSTVNLDGAIALSITAAMTAPAVILYPGSTAAAGRPEQRVTNATALRPVATYGAHKALPKSICRYDTTLPDRWPRHAARGHRRPTYDTSSG